jgi:hypothetical protein
VTLASSREPDDAVLAVTPHRGEPAGPPLAHEGAQRRR